MTITEHEARSVPYAGMVTCLFCGAQAYGTPPHGEREPCPYQTKKLDAEAHLIRAQTRQLIAETSAYGTDEPQA